MIESAKAICGCQVKVTVDVSNHAYDGIGRVEIVVPCELHAITRKSTRPTCISCNRKTSMKPDLYGEFCAECYQLAGGDIDDPKPLTPMQLLEFWGFRLQHSRTPKQFEQARQQYNKVVDSLRVAPATL